MNEHEQWTTIEARLVGKAWKDESFRQALLREPRAVLERELGAALPGDLTIQVVAPPANTLCLVLPAAPVAAAGALSDADLDAVSGAAPQSSSCPPN